MSPTADPNRVVTGMAPSLRELKPDPKAHTQSFSELAQARLPPAMKHTVAGLRQIPRDVKPSDANLKELRKELQRVRDLIDIFAQALPAEGQLKFRKLLDKGYETIGAFKDISVAKDVMAGSLKPATAKEPKARRAAFNAWRDDFLSEKRQKAFADLLKHAELNGNADGSRKVARMFWGTVDASRLPSSTRTGLQNLVNLANGLVGASQKAGEPAMKAVDPVKDEPVIHAFRKQLRNTTNFYANFPELAPPHLQHPLEDLRKFIEALGEVEDRNVALKFALKRGATEIAELIRADASKAWREAQALHRSLDVTGLLQKLDRALAR